jgi:hypothetical protein
MSDIEPGDSKMLLAPFTGLKRRAITNRAHLCGRLPRIL